MAMDEFDPQDERATRTTRRPSPTDRLTTETGSSYGDPVRQNWRSDRAAGRTRRNQTLPSSRQELVVWLQHGGWRFVAGVAVVVILLLFGLVLFSRRSAQTASTTRPTITTLGQTIPGQQPTLAPRPEPTIAPAPPAAATGAQFRVTGTDTDGLFLRSDHVSEGAPLKTLPEGTIVTVIGEDFSGPDRVWKRVRDPDGTEGWVAIDFLKPVQ